MSKKQEMEIRHKAETVEIALRARGIYHLPNEPGVSFGVLQEITRRHFNSDLKVDHPRHGFGGEYVFRSATHLGTKEEGGDA